MKKVTQNNRTALICGASGGLGSVLAQTLMANGFRVFGTMRLPSAPDNYPFPMVAMDITDPASVASCLSDVRALAGRIDVVINCINELTIGAVDELSDAEFKKVYQINVLGLFSLCRNVVQIMREQNGGTIINMSSLGGVLAAPYLSAYTSSKFAVEAFSEALYHEVRADNIDVVIMQPTAMYMERPSVGSHLKISSGVGANSKSQQMIRMMAKDTVESRLTPEVVAEKIHQVIISKKKKLRYPMGRARAFSVIKRIAPQNVINKLIAKAVASAGSPDGSAVVGKSPSEAATK